MEMARLNEAGVAVMAGFIHIYHVSPETGELLRESDEYLSEGVGVPAYSCIDKPPAAKDGFAVCRGADSWGYVEDHRGVAVYSTETGELIKIMVIGPLPGNTTTLQPETAFDRWNGERWVTDEAAKSQAIIALAIVEKEQRLKESDIEIERLRDAIELEMATDEEVSLYTEWRKYRVLLNQMDMSKAPDIKWPTRPISG